MVFGAIAMVSHPLMGFFVLSGYIASAARLQKAPHPLVLYSDQRKKEFQRTMGWISGAGIVLGRLNLGLGSGSVNDAAGFCLIFLFDALRAGLFEEILFCTFLYAFCVEVAGKKKIQSHPDVFLPFDHDPAAGSDSFPRHG